MNESQENNFKRCRHPNPLPRKLLLTPSASSHCYLPHRVADSTYERLYVCFLEFWSHWIVIYISIWQCPCQIVNFSQQDTLLDLLLQTEGIAHDWKRFLKMWRIKKYKKERRNSIYSFICKHQLWEEQSLDYIQL